MMNPKRVLIFLFLFPFCSGFAQTRPPQVRSVLQQQTLTHATVAYLLQEYLLNKTHALPKPSNAEEWTREEARIRKDILQNIVFHGWPKEWVDSPPKFEDMGVIPGGDGYQMRKLRYEIVPGFYCDAILYEPLHVRGKAPAILNVEGHDPFGISSEAKQKRCINVAKRGIFTLSIDWVGFGELYVPENNHDYGPDLDLVGSNVLGLFYLTMRRGLDYLASLPQVDPNRLGMTGESGGGWQTIVLSSLDPRVRVMVEVAGFGPSEENITHPHETDCDEQDAPDFDDGHDYTLLEAIRAPRPTMLIHDAEDTCCFRADLVKPYIYDRIKPFFKLYGKEDAFRWYENRDPGTHNYYLDNREHSYAFFTKFFDMPVMPTEIPSWSEIKTADELAVPLPKDNLTMLGLAKKFAGEIERPPITSSSSERESWAASERAKLRSVVRYKPVEIKRASRMWNTKNKGLQSLSYRFDFSNELVASGIWLKAIAAPEDGPATIVLNDEGKQASADIVSDRVDRGEQVLAMDLLFNGETMPSAPDDSYYCLFVSNTGDRPLGMEAAQLLALTQWLQRQSSHPKIRLETSGIRSEVIGLVAAALDPAAYSEVVSYDGMKSLGYLLDKPVSFRSAPDLFCLDLYKDFDLDRFAAIAAPARWITNAEKPPAE
jgi:dienelactone hydrolase